MKVLFLTIGQIQDLNGKSVHIDIIKALKNAGHSVSVLATSEKKLGKNTEFVVEDGVRILRLKIGNLTKCSIIEKGITTITLEGKFKRAIRKYYKNDEFDLVIYNTPPITLAGAVKYAKKLFKCKSYLMLKDIFPQNAVDIGLMSTSGIKGLMYKMFRKKEIQLYRVSDRIGCMSEENKRYLLQNNPYISEKNVEIFPNSVYNIDKVKKDRSIIKKIGLDENKITFIYGGNLGMPQGLDFLSKAIVSSQNIENVQFVIVGSGSEKIKFYDSLQQIKNCKCLDFLPHSEYIKLCASCDIGIISLDHRFTIPNYPSRLLSYMENAMPILACTDKVTDIRQLVQSQANCGKWCYSDSVEDFVSCVKWFCDNSDQIKILGENGLIYLKEHFTTDICVKLLTDFVQN